jgi:hypothetical protein
MYLCELDLSVTLFIYSGEEKMNFSPLFLSGLNKTNIFYAFSCSAFLKKIKE